MLRAPEPRDGCSKLEAPHYLRIAKTGSTTALEFIHRTGCVKHGHLGKAYIHHGDIPREQMQLGKPTVVVMRDPCERARSTLHWWRNLTWRQPDHPVHNLSSLAAFAAFVGRLPQTMPKIWSGADYHRMYALVWEQARYINKCTQIICFDEGPGLERSLQKLCHTSQPLRQLNLGRGNESVLPEPSNPTQPRQLGREGDAAECEPIRQLYHRDELLWQSRCRGGRATAAPVTSRAPVPARAPAPKTAAPKTGAPKTAVANCRHLPGGCGGKAAVAAQQTRRDVLERT